MVNNKICVIALSIFSISTTGNCKPKSFSVKSVMVEETGIYQEQIPSYLSKEACSRFKPTNKMVFNWIKKAKEVKQSSFMETSTITQCSAKGHLVTSDGKEYAWELDPGGGAIIDTAPSSPTEAVYLIGPMIPY
ncbi:hypothetical protein [Nitrospirillum pindoramense]|uniref:hypothetical protein n=1 Tax=Nitrospirillum amazonense TaxID=28077 RepID=UPI0011AAF6B2|nr:hypothetical protein [Nitrospirillum amazonense]